MPSGVAGAPGGWLPSLTFDVRFPDQDHPDWPRPPITAELPKPPRQPDMTTIQTQTQIASGDGHTLLAWGVLPGVALRLIEPVGPANGRQPARRVAMRTHSVAGSRR
jgi:hypothetical protein